MADRETGTVKVSHFFSQLCLLTCQLADDVRNGTTRALVSLRATLRATGKTPLAKLLGPSPLLGSLPH